MIIDYYYYYYFCYLPCTFRAFCDSYIDATRFYTLFVNKRLVFLNAVLLVVWVCALYSRLTCEFAGYFTKICHCVVCSVLFGMERIVQVPAVVQIIQMRVFLYGGKGLRPLSWQDWSQTGLGLGPGLILLVLVLVLVLHFWSCYQHCCARQALCDMIILKCNKYLYFSCNRCRNSAKCNWSSYYFLTFSAQSYFLTTKMRVAAEEFFLLCSLAVA